MVDTHRNTRIRDLARRTLVGATLVVLAMIGLVATATPAAAADGLDIEASYVYRLGDDGVLRVEATYTLTNVTANTRRGNVITYYYYDRFWVPLPEGATELAVTDGSRDLTHSIDVEEDEAGGRAEYVEVSFGRLRYQRTQQIVVTYVAGASEPRSEWVDRVNPAYAYFGAFGFADPGQLDVRVEIPHGYEVEFNALGDDDQVARNTTWTDGTTLVAEAIENPEEFLLLVTARNDANLELTEVEVLDTRIDVRGWPGDDEWQEMAVDTITTGLPELAELVGQPWPEQYGFDVIQSAEPNEYGYAGWFDLISDEILVDESLDPLLMLHELSHAWFNSRTFEHRWMIEGFAEEVSRLIAEDLGEDVVDAEGPASYERRNLLDWDDGLRTANTEEWGYDTSAWFMRQITDELGREAFEDLVKAMFDESPVFTDEQGEPVGEPRTDWQRLLDVVETRHGSVAIDELLREHVLPEDLHDELDERRVAHDRLAELEAASSPWAVPLGVLTGLEEWSFTDSVEIADAADEVLDLRAELAARSESAGVVTHAVGEDAYEAAISPDFAASAREFRVRLDALARIEQSDVQFASFTPTRLEELGLRGRDLDAAHAALREAYDRDDLPGVAAALVDEVILRADAEALGTERATYGGIGIAGAFLLFVMTVVWLVRRRRRRRAARRPEPIETALPVAGHELGDPDGLVDLAAGAELLHVGLEVEDGSAVDGVEPDHGEGRAVDPE